MKKYCMMLIQTYNSMVETLKKNNLLVNKGDLWEEVLSEGILICGLCLEHDILVSMVSDGSIHY